MISSILLALPPQVTAEELLKRIDARSGAGFSVDFTLDHNSIGLVKAHLELKQPHFVSLRAQGDGDDFEFMVGKSGAIEIEHKTRQYCEVGPIGRVQFTNSTLSGLSFRCVPYALMGDIGSIFQQRLSVQSEKSGGKTVYKMSSPGPEVIAEIWVTEAGLIQRYKHEFTDVSGRVKMDFKFSNHGAFHPASINLEPPIGYRMTLLKRDTLPIQPGSEFPASGWSGKVLDGKPTLFVVCAKECEITNRMGALLSDLAKSSRVVVLSDNGNPRDLAKLPTYSSKQGSVFDRLNTPGSPTLYAVNAKGIVQQLWFGFDPKEAVPLKDAILSALRR